MPLTNNRFDALRISLADTETILSWSYGEVTSPETLHYRTLQPVPDGLFCERIFGPTRDYRCRCDKYNLGRDGNSVIDKICDEPDCGVQVTERSARRSRMGHVTLAAPVAHTWYSTGNGSPMSQLLGLTPQDLGRIRSYGIFVVVAVNHARIRDRQAEFTRAQDFIAERIRFVAGNDEDPVERLSAYLSALHEQRNALEHSGEPEMEASELDGLDEKIEQAINDIQAVQHLQTEMENLGLQLARLHDLQVGAPVSTHRRAEILAEYGEDVVTLETGGDALLQLLTGLDLDALAARLRDEIRELTGPELTRCLQRLEWVERFRKSGTPPRDMILTVLPVLPPELRPMIPMTGGKIASDDLNDLYRRVVYRNIRLSLFLERGSPDLIVNNERRMLQDAVDALFDNSGLANPSTAINGRVHRSLSDHLRGKEGRFRQNLLGKRVDYSGRTVIVAGPDLKLRQCGLPRTMALELFRPFIIARLLNRYGYDYREATHILGSSGALAEHPVVWEILDDVANGKYVLLNRAPTLHRLGIQAFEPVLVDGSAIQLHPMVCAAFNADFDGDQMAVHLPISDEARHEARTLMLSTTNLIAPGSGEPIALPNLDVLLGLYDMTIMEESPDGDPVPGFATPEEALACHRARGVRLRQPVLVRLPGCEGPIVTTPGRLLVRETLPDFVKWRNQPVRKGDLKDMVSTTHAAMGHEVTASLLDDIMQLGFSYATHLGVSISIGDLLVPPAKTAIIAEAEQKVLEIADQLESGLLTDGERHTLVISVWNEASDRLTERVEEAMVDCGGLFLMASSGAKGNISNIKQMIGMRGLMSNPKGETIERPIKSNFREGLSVLEYFISTHGARKGLADTALRTADAGYLTRRLVDAAQDVVIKIKDCGTEASLLIDRNEIAEGSASFQDELRYRLAAEPLRAPDGSLIVRRDEVIDETVVENIVRHGINRVSVRSPMHCREFPGLCASCYGIFPGSGELARVGEAVGVVGAQSIGEPGTQLTMRTFHAGGVAGTDITSGLPRVAEIFEARHPKVVAVTATTAGVVRIEDGPEGTVVVVDSKGPRRQRYVLGPGVTPSVAANEPVELEQVIALDSNNEPAMLSITDGQVVEVSEHAIDVRWHDDSSYDHPVTPGLGVIVATGDTVRTGQALTRGSLNPHEVLAVNGRAAVQRYIIEEVQRVYLSQGVPIHSKHIEVILSRMLGFVTVASEGDSDYLPGTMVPWQEFQGVCASILGMHGVQPTATDTLLGVTKSALNADGFLAAASFQRTSAVLTEAAVERKVDRLKSLKSSIMLGRLVSARLRNESGGAA